MDAMSGISAGIGQMNTSLNVSALNSTDVGATQSSGAADGLSQINYSSTSISSNVQSLVASSTGGSSNKDLMGALLLLLTMQYLQSNDPQQQKDLMSLLGSMLQQGGAGAGGDGGSSMLMYSSSSLSIESTSLQVVSSSTGLDAYSGASNPTGQISGTDGTSAGLDVIA